MQPLQQRLGDALGALDLVGRGRDLRSELAGAGDRVGSGLDVHTSPHIGEAIAAERRCAVNRFIGAFSRQWTTCYPPLDGWNSPIARIRDPWAIPIN
jgi:hypothetical protein